MDDCPAVAVKIGLCNRHYQSQRLRRAPKGTDRRCTIDGCRRRHHARGWCSSHYQRWKAYGDPLHETHRYRYRTRPKPKDVPLAALRTIRLPVEVARRADYLAAASGQTFAAWARGLVTEAVGA
jgi:hypothetical protein